VFPLEASSAFAALQSRVHEFWTLLLASGLEDRSGYRPSDCFETFPFPQPDPRSVIPELEAIGEKLYAARAAYMLDTNQGLTKTYNALKDPSCTDPRILELRALHEEMDRAVLRAYPRLPASVVQHTGAGADTGPNVASAAALELATGGNRVNRADVTAPDRATGVHLNGAGITGVVLTDGPDAPGPVHVNYADVVGWSDIPVPPFCIATEADKSALRLFVLNELRAKEEKLQGKKPGKGTAGKKPAKPAPKAVLNSPSASNAAEAEPKATRKKSKKPEDQGDLF
jgi:hypothetical protein